VAALVSGLPFVAVQARRLSAAVMSAAALVLGLSWQWVNLEGGRIRIEQQLRPSLDLGPPKTRRSRRQVALGAETVDALSRHRDVQLAERTFAGPAYQDGDLVFADEIGRPISPRAFSAAFHRHRRRAGTPVGTLHILRHTHAKAITTIEGLASNGTLHAVQEAFREKHGLQCGYCTPGMIMATVDLLAESPNPSDEEIRYALEGNLCRCTGYENIVLAVHEAAGVAR
jgi:hypothetical protein